VTRSDDRLDDLPMTPVQCQRCHAIVQVRKSSWQQTSVQWDEAGARTCPERRTSLSGGGIREADFFTCAGLRESIAQAALSGTIPLVDDVDEETGSAPREGRGPAGAAAEETAVAQ
jgi:YD repeat-containing protein